LISLLGIAFFCTLNYKKSCMERKLSTQLIIEPLFIDQKILSTTVAKEPILRQSKKPTVVGFLRYKVLS
ncbi:hypothetical protein, partial [Streptococcus danieliae]|uniref:hypothetical protein n=1 Tax=Streptococcus danieliae TaxID=747656 RepID=UPI0026EC761D